MGVGTSHMFQKSLVIHTVAVLIIGILLNVFLEEPVSVTTDNFETSIGKFLFDVSAFLIVGPVVFHLISMWLDMFAKRRFIWVAATFFLFFASTLSYYFWVYRSESGT